MRFSINPSSWVDTIPGMNTNWEKKSWRATLWRRILGFWWMKSLTWTSAVSMKPKRPVYPGLHQNRGGQCGEGGDRPHPMLFMWSSSCSAVSRLGDSSTGKMWSLWILPEKSHKNYQGAEVPLLWGKVKTAGLVYLRKVKLQWDFTAPF